MANPARQVRGVERNKVEICDIERILGCVTTPRFATRGDEMTAPTTFSHFRRFHRSALLHVRYDQHTFDRHAHDEYVVGVNLVGLEAVWLDGQIYHVPPGLITAYNPGAIQGGTCLSDSGWEYVTLYFDIPLVEEVCDALRPIRGPGFPALRHPVFDDAALARQLLAMSFPWDTDPMYTEERILLFVGRLFERHGEVHRKAQKVPTTPGVGRAIAYLTEHAYRRVSLQELSAASGLSRYHLVRTVQRDTGFSPRAYQLHLRVQEAKRRLATSLPLAELAFELGFVDQSHFHRTFKRMVGVTPHVYRSGL